MVEMGGSGLFRLSLAFALDFSRRVRGFFLLAAAWVDPGRNALQSAEQRC